MSALIKSLVRFGKTADENLASLKTELAAAFKEMAAGQGARVLSGSGNGLNFTVDGQMTVAEWFTVLQEAVTIIETARPNTSVIAFR